MFFSKNPSKSNDSFCFSYKEKEVNPRSYLITFDQPLFKIFGDIIGVEPASPSKSGILQFSENNHKINNAGSTFKWPFFYPYLNEIHHMG